MRKMIAEVFKKAHPPENKIPAKVQGVFSKHTACYVLIACGEPSEEGKIQVEMVYEGDEVLAAYLIESAKSFIEDPT